MSNSQQKVLNYEGLQYFYNGLTEHFAPVDHSSTAKTFGVGSTTNYGHLKVGSNLSVSSGIISLSKDNVISALGYVPPTTDTMGAATSSAAGSSGLVPAPAAGEQSNFLRGDGTWAVPTDTKVTQTVCTTNGEFPILLRGTSAGTTTATTTTSFASGITLNPNTGTLSTNFLKITNTSGTGQIAFSRIGFNYLWAPEGGTIALCVGSIANQANSPLCASATSVNPGTSNIVGLGTSVKKWLNVYATDFYGSGAGLTNLNADNISSGILSVARGGTGATTAPETRVALGICSTTTDIVYNSSNIIASSTEPTNPTEGMIWLKI